MLIGILLPFLILDTFVREALCCWCESEHAQTRFCKTEFVLKVLIHEEIKLTKSKSFMMEIQKVFKGDVQELNLVQNRSVILDMSPLCPVRNMKTGDKYVIFGESKEGNIYTANCYGNYRWEMTTRFYRRALEKYYKSNCDCYPNSTDNTNPSGCQWMYSYRKKIGSNCKWVQSSDLQHCEMLS